MHQQSVRRHVTVTNSGDVPGEENAEEERRGKRGQTGNICSWSSNNKGSGRNEVENTWGFRPQSVGFKSIRTDPTAKPGLR